MLALRCVCNLCLLSLLGFMAGCSNGRGSLDEQEPPQAQDSFSIGGTVSGLMGSGLVLSNNGGSDLPIAANGAFTFAGLLGSGAAYDVTVRSQPSGPAQSCTVVNGSGAVGTSNVTTVAVTCATGTFAVGGTVTGLQGSGLILQNAGADDLQIVANGPFIFAGTIAPGATYDVSVVAQPRNPAQICTVADGSGTMGAADVTNVQVTCATGQFSVGGVVSGLLGSGLILQNNGGDDLPIAANGGFQFSEPLATGATYSVGVKAHPTGPTQNCVIANAAGTIADANVSNVTVACSAERFTIGGDVAGLLGSGLVLQLNSANDLEVVRDGRFAFGVALASGTTYVVSIKKQPSSPTQTCTIANAAGVVAAGNVIDVAVTCRTTSFSIGGRVSGLIGGGLVLQLNDGDDLEIASNGSFTFATTLPSGARYRVSAASQPSDPPQVCTIANAAGTIGAGDVTTVRVTCAANTFSIGGTVSGLLGTGLVLENNGGDHLAVSSDGAFTFPLQLANHASYDITVRTQPVDPTQACTVANGTGTVDGADVTSVSIGCSTSDFTIGGEVSGLAGSGLILLNNGTDELTIDSNGQFRFANALPGGSIYSVTIAEQPRHPDQTCTLANASGVVGTADVNDVAVTCSTRGFTVGGHVSHLSGSGLTLQNNGSDTLEIASSGRFRFPTSLASGTPYNVTIARQPVDPDQTCTVSDGSGTVRRSDIKDVDVECEEEDDDDDDD